MLGQQDLAKADDVLGLGVEQADRFDVVAKSSLAEVEHRQRRFDSLEEALGCLVNPNIGRLGRQHDGNQKGVVIFVNKFAARIGVGLGQPREKRFDVGFFHPKNLTGGRPHASEKRFRSVALPPYQHYSRVMIGVQTGAIGVAKPLLFNVELFPHRSLSPRGFRLLIGGVAAIGLIVGGAFYLAGAWPVIGFLGLEVVLLYTAFKISYNRARLSERVMLSENALLVRRVNPDRREQIWRFPPYWLRVTVPDPERSDSHLVLTSHGRRLTIGTFLPVVSRSGRPSRFPV